MKKGFVSVVMAVHNEQPSYLQQSFASIFRQTYPEMELIVVDDASDDKCQEVIRDLCKNKDNVKVVRNETNQGLTKSLNRGIELAEGEFIARMDADDVSMIDRIEKQVGYLHSHPDIDFVGTGVVSFGTENIFMSPAFGFNNDDAQCNLFFSSTLCHPSVLRRKVFLDRHNLRYDENIKKGQDYDLWERASVYGKIAVMSDVLLFYRIHDSQITNKNRADQDSSADKVRKRRLSRIGIEVSDREFKCHHLLACGVDKTIGVREVDTWVKKIIEHNVRYHLVDEKSLINNLRLRLSLYKLRNHTGVLSFGPSDIIIMFKVFVHRLKMHAKLKQTNKLFQKYYVENEK